MKLFYDIIYFGDIKLNNFLDFTKLNDSCITENQSKDRNSLVFAFVGDAVFSLYVRTYLADISTAKAGVLHGQAVKFVRASFQSYLLNEIFDKLTEQEKFIVTNARNAKTNNVAKHSNLDEYKKSTSFEAVLGYLYLTGQNDRLYEVLELCKEKIKEQL